MNNFDLQLRSIRYAIKELNKELKSAREAINSEWIEDCLFHISNLNAAIETIEAMKALEKVFKK